MGKGDELPHTAPLGTLTGFNDKTFSLKQPQKSQYGII